MQIVGYDPTPSPSIYLAEDGRVEQYPLTVGDRLTFSLGARHCAGRIEANRHLLCDEAKAPRCAHHEDTWICARCRGTCLKDEMDCHFEHDVYLAAFAPDEFKVGVTRTGRFRERLTEQGADRGVRIRRVTNGRIAREIEAEIATDLPDRIEMQTKLDGLTRSVDEGAWDDLLAGFDVHERYRPTYSLALDSPPIPETVARGEIVGIKGRILCLTWSGSTYATDLRGLVGHHIEPEATTREVQSGLGAFS